MPKTCLNAAQDGSLSFPAILGALPHAGFEGYAVDYRRSSQTFYLPNDDNIELDMPHAAGSAEATFDGTGVEALIRWAQANGPDYSYLAFCEKVKLAAPQHRWPCRGCLCRLERSRACGIDTREQRIG